MAVISILKNLKKDNNRPLIANIMFDYCIIMAGGSGTRLWPASNTEKSKQFLPVSRENKTDTFFSASLERAFSTLNPHGEVIVVAGKTHVPHIIESCALLKADERKRIVVIPEPQAKNTAAAVLCGIVYTERVAGAGRTILVLTSDHLISPLSAFKSDAESVLDFIKDGHLAVFGIPPKKAETGYGYIEAADDLKEAKVYQVASFREKPDRKKAEEFIATGRFYWNSGMFAFSSSAMMKAFRDNASEVYLPFEKIKTPAETAYSVNQDVRILSNWLNLEDVYAEAKNISFDYAIAEKYAHTVMVKAGFDWRDIGSWDEYALLLGDTGSEIYQVNSSSCFVDSDIPVALCAVDDLIVVVRSGKDGRAASVLIAKKGETQAVKDITEQIKLAGKKNLL